MGVMFTTLLVLACWSQNFYSSYSFNSVPQWKGFQIQYLIQLDLNCKYQFWHPTLQQQYKVATEFVDDFWLDSYTRLWGRYHVYGVGILFGWFILSYRSEGNIRAFLTKSRLRQVTIIVAMWVLCVSCLLIPVYLITWCYEVDFTNPDLTNGTHPEVKWNAMSGCASTNLTSSFWNASFRIVWGVGVGLLIVLCDMGYGFCIQSFLAAKPFHVIGKLSYCIYLFHYAIITSYEQSLMEPVYLDKFSLAWMFLSVVTASVAVAMITCLFVEMPIAMLWSYCMLYITGHTNRKRDQLDQLDQLDQPEKTNLTVTRKSNITSL